MTTIPSTPTSDGQGRTGEPIGNFGTLTEADLRNMSAIEIVQARKEGRLDHLLGITKH